MNIGNKVVGFDHPPFIIAEMSGNHNQSLDRALALVDAAAQAGVHALKLQTYTADTMTLDVNEGEFHIANLNPLWDGASLYNLYKEAYTPWEWHEPIFKRAAEHGMIAFSSPFDETAVDFLEKLDVPCYKIASFENTDTPLIRKVASTGKPMIISTGMASVAELDEAVTAAREAGCKDLVLLKCTSTYPATPRNTNIVTIPHLRSLFGCEVGLSDHTMGIGVSVAAVALGATVVEKHFTLRRADGGVNSAFSLEPEELGALVTETERAWQSIGVVRYGATDAEEKSKKYRRSIYITRDVRAGEVLGATNIRIIRPGNGLPPLSSSASKAGRSARMRGAEHHFHGTCFDTAFSEHSVESLHLVMRLPKLASLTFLFTLIKDRYFLSGSKRRYYEFFSELNKDRHTIGSPARIVTVQCVEDFAYFGIFASIIAQLRKTHSVRVDLYVLRSLRMGSSISLKGFLWSVVSSNFMSDNTWKRLYFSFCDHVAYRSAAWMTPWTELSVLWTTLRIRRGLEGVEDLAGLTIRSVKIGDLIIDSYVRFKPSPAVKLHDHYLVIVIRQALRDIEKAFRYFEVVKPDLYLTSYTTYIQHGIPARVAAACGVQVLSLGNFQEFSKSITLADLHQTKTSAAYAADFSNLPDQYPKIAQADQLLSDRVLGNIDTSTAYMKASAYQESGEIVPDVRGSLVIFLHDFYDSVHIYPWILFHDFWTWICFTIEALNRHAVPFFIKPHPNQIDASDEAFLELCRKYPNLRVLPRNINNRQLAEGGLAGAVTVYGTVASEMAYFGVPTISCGDNPHSSFSFCHVARSHAEYEAMLRDFRSFRIDRIGMREQACAFFYMHNMNLDEEAAELRDKSIKLRTTIWANPTRSAEDVIADFEEFQAVDGLNVFCKRLRHIG